jgi:NADH-quinone oxidoreductase subunit G
LHGIEPEYDVANPDQWQKNLLSADMVIAVTPFVSESLKKVAKVLLPCAAFTETSGTFINLAGEQHSFAGCVAPKGEARPGWKIYRVLGNLLDVPAFDFESSEDILKSLGHQEGPPVGRPYVHLLPQHVEATDRSASVTPDVNQLERITTWPDCRSDSLVRRARALNQRAAEARFEAVHIHAETAKQLQLIDGQAVHIKQDQAHVASEIAINNQVAIGAVFIAGGTTLAAQLGNAAGYIEIIKC